MRRLILQLFSKIWADTRNGNHDEVSIIHRRPNFLKLIELERDRVHRTNNQFSMLLFNVNPKNKQDIVELATQLSKRVRRIDQVGWYDKNRIGVLLPNTSPAGAQIIAKDICQLNYSRMYETLSYPDIVPFIQCTSVIVDSEVKADGFEPIKYTE